MKKQLFTILQYLAAIATLGILINSTGWLLIFSLILWGPAFILHLYAIHRNSDAAPWVRRFSWLSSTGFLVFSLVRYDGGDSGGFTGLSCLLASLNLRSTAMLGGSAWEYLQLTYAYLFIQIFMDLKIIKMVRQRTWS